jgi:hypothetical protein
MSAPASSSATGPFGADPSRGAKATLSSDNQVTGESQTRREGRYQQRRPNEVRGVFRSGPFKQVIYTEVRRHLG